MSAPRRWPDLQAWSHRVAGDAADAQTLVKELAANGWLPSEQQDIALRAAQRPPDSLSHAVLCQAWNAEAARLESEISAYSAEFFQMPIEERQRRHQDLNRQCRFAPHLLARLNTLSFGLQIELTEPADAGAPTAQIERGLAGLFVLPPSARLRRGRELAAEWQARGLGEAKLIERVRHESPLAPLVPDALRAAEDSMGTDDPVLRQTPFERPPQRTSVRFDVGAQKSNADEFRNEVPPTNRSKAPSRAGVGVVVALFFVLRLIIVGSDSHKPPPTYAAPRREYEVPRPFVLPDEEKKRIDVMSQKRFQELLEQQGFKFPEGHGLPPLRTDKSAIPPTSPSGNSLGSRR